MKKKAFTIDSKISKASDEFTRWLNKLDKYHTNRFDPNYRQYTSYSETKGTSSKISDPLAPELIERVVQRLFEREPKFFALTRGHNIPREITDIISAIPQYYWSCPERVMTSGTMKSKLKVWGREFCTIGNLATEDYYNPKSDTPDTRIIPTEDVVFDPTATLKTSSKYYIRQYVSMQYLEDNIKTVDKDGTVRGIFDKAAVERLKIEKQNDKTVGKVIKDDPTHNQINRSGSNMYEKMVDDVLLVSLWEGKKVTRFADWTVIVQEEDDPLQIDDHPFQFAMDIEVPKEPYAFGLLDFIKGLTDTKDLILNQIIDYGSKALNPPLYVDINQVGPVNKVTLRNAFKIGGIVFAPPQSVEHKPMPALPNAGFELLNYLQQRGESGAGIGGYTGGISNQVSDKTKGTATGVKALIEQGSAPIKDRQQNLEESIIEPMVNKWLKMAGNLMGENEIKYVLITGQSPKWVRVTKGLLTGKITLPDLMEAEIVDEEAAGEIATELAIQGKDPEKELIFDVDWILRVETGSMAEVDLAQELENFDQTVQSGIQMQVPLDLQKLWVERAMKAGIKEPEQYIQKAQAMGGMQQPMIGSTPVTMPQMQ